jgi:predicted negative regulator of RcsB-dependent stress response
VGLGLVALDALADTIVLKNGRRIVAPNVVEENGRVSYETPAGRLSLPRSIVERIERGGGFTGDAGASSAAQLPIGPPEVEPGEGYDEIARAAVHDGSIDQAYLARLEGAAGDGAAATAARAAVAHAAAAQFELRHRDIEQAIAHYRRALTFAPPQPNLFLGISLNIAYLHLRRSEYTAALDYLDRVRRVVPDSADVAKLSGWAYYGLNRLDQAVEEWKRALRLRPDAEVQRALEKAERDQQAESSYREGETRHFTLRYYGGAAPQLARDILRALEEHFRAIESELNFTPPEPIGVILYTEQAFADITRAPGWVGALNDGRIRVPVQGLTSVPAELSRVLKHELTHSFIQQKTRGRCPVWLQEGIAQWMEGRRSRENADLLVSVYERKAALRLGAMEGSWMGLPEGVASYAYAWSLAVVEYIVETYGMRDIERLLDHVATDASTEAAARTSLRMDYAELQQETAKYLRHAYLR